MRVALVCPYGLDRFGGVQTQAVELARRLVEAGHRAWVVAPGEGQPGTQVVGRSIGVPINRSVAPVALDPRSGRRVLEAVAGADVVHVHEPFVPMVSLAAALRSESPRVATFHADPPRWVRGLYRWGGPVWRGVLDRFRVVTAVSPVAAEPIVGLGRDPRIIPNGLDTALYRVEAERDPGRVAFLGRDDPRKGLPVLLAAWPAVRQVVPGAELVVLGAPPIEGAPPGVRFRGRVTEEEKRAELAVSVVLCAPNLGGESFGLVPLEGMAAGCAVVASRLPAFVHVLEGAGVLVPPGESVSLAEALVGVLRDPDRARRLGESGRERAEAFDWGRVLPRYLEVYEEAMR